MNVDGHGLIIEDIIEHRAIHEAASCRVYESLLTGIGSITVSFIILAFSF